MRNTYLIFIGLILFFAIIGCQQQPSQEATNTNTQEEKPEGLSKEDMLKKGKQYALQTKATLGQNLFKAIKEYGADGAVEFCSEQAYPLTDSMGKHFGVQIKRVSDQPRNPKNSANESQLAYIKQSKQALAEGQTLKPQLQQVDNKQVAYYPILTNEMCLQCHGTAEKEIAVKTLQKLNERYPKDQARGYGTNELRGIWVVTMP